MQVKRLMQRGITTLKQLIAYRDSCSSLFVFSSITRNYGLVNFNPTHFIDSRAPIYCLFPSRYREAYQLELDYFLDIVQGCQSCDPVEEGKVVKAVSRVAMACEESARTGNPVKLEWRPEEIPNDYKSADMKITQNGK